MFTNQKSDTPSSSPIQPYHLSGLGPFWEHLDAKGLKRTLNNLKQFNA